MELSGPHGLPRGRQKLQKMEPRAPKMTQDLGTDLGTRIGPDFLRFFVMLGASRGPDDLRLDM